MFGFLQMERVVGAPESAIVRELYLAQVPTWTFWTKLQIHNVTSLLWLTVGGRWRWVTTSQVMEQLLKNGGFEAVSKLSMARIDRLAGKFVFQHPEMLGWYSRRTAQHELLHLGQYLRDAHLWEKWPQRLVHEYWPCLLGPPLNTGIVVAGTSLGGIFGTQVYWMFDDLWEALLPRIIGFNNQQRR